MKNIITGNSTVAIYVPSKSSNTDIPEEAHGTWVDKTARFMSEIFGGATAEKAIGYWISKGGELIKEVTTIVYSYSDEEKIDRSFDDLFRFCEDMKDEMSQESVMMKLDNRVVFV